MKQPPVFRRVELHRETLSDKVVDEVRRLIDEGHFVAGDRLPPERELVDLLGISRTVLREALSSLEALGIIESRSTRGRFIAEGGLSARSRTLVGAWLHQHAAELSEIEEVRSIVESEALRMSPEEAWIEIARRGRETVTAQADALQREDFKSAGRADTEFHSLLCSAAPNRTLLELATALIDRARHVSLAAYTIPELAQVGMEEHRGIVEAIEAGDVELAAARLKEHNLASSRRNVEVDPPGSDHGQTDGQRPMPDDGAEGADQG